MILRASCGINYEEFVEFLNVIAKERIWTITGQAVATDSKETKLDNKTSLKRTEFNSSVFQDWSSAMNILEGREQQSLIDYCRYDLVKVKECLISLKDEHSFKELQNKDLQIRVDDLLQEMHTTLTSGITKTAVT